MLVLYCAIQGPDSLFIRPHPTFWKVVHGVSIVYLLALVFVLFQSTGTVRALLKELDPELGVPLPEQSYAADCRLYTPEDPHSRFARLKEVVFDIFVVAHVLGWIGKALVLRDYKILWAISVMFELMELTFRHWLLNFNECWWDSWVLDVAVCNFLGMWIGMQVVQRLEGKRYDWAGLSKLPGVFPKLNRAVWQFTPEYWHPRAWCVFASPTRLLQTLVIVGLVLTFELNAFWLKTIFWLQPEHPYNTYRLLLWFFFAMPAVHEYYVFISEADRVPVNKMGPYAWTSIFIATTEILVIYKHSRGLFPAPWPPEVVRAWSIAGTAFVAGLATWQALRSAGFFAAGKQA